MERALDNIELSRVVSDMLARMAAIESRQPRVQAVQQPPAASTRALVLLNSPVTIASASTTVTTYTNSGVGQFMPDGATEAFVEVYTNTGESEQVVYFSPDGVTGYVGASTNSSTGGSGDVGRRECMFVPLGTGKTFFYAVNGPGTVSWGTWSIKLVGYR